MIFNNQKKMLHANTRIAFSIIFIFMTSCGRDSEYIGNGLKVIDLSSKNFAITHGYSIVVPNKIIFYCKNEFTVKGFRVDPKDDNAIPDDPDFTENLGYFELDIKSLKVTHFPDVNIVQARKKCGK